MILNTKLTQITPVPGDPDYNEGRYYLNDEKPGIKYYSCTNIINAQSDKAGLVKWAASVGEEEATRIRETAASIGSNVHEALETGETKYLSDEELVYFNYNQQFLDLVTPVHKEAQIIWEGYFTADRVRLKQPGPNTTTYGFAGSCDLIIKAEPDVFTNQFGNKLFTEPVYAIADYKNKRKLPKPKYLLSYAIQCAAYAAAVNSMTDDELKIRNAFISIATPGAHAIFYINPVKIKFYWAAFQQMVWCFYNQQMFDWKTMGYIAEHGDSTYKTYLPTRVYPSK